MICRDCGKEFFDEEHLRRKLCDDCRREHRRAIDRNRILRDKADPVRRERRKQIKRNYYHRHKERCIAYNKKYMQEHAEEINAYHRERWKRMTPDDKRRRLLNGKLRKAVANDEHKPFCQWCGRDFKPKYKGEKYCSEECYRHSPLRRICADNPEFLKRLCKIFLGKI